MRYIFELDDDHTSDFAVTVEETRGLLRFRLSPEIFPPEAVAALNATSAQVLAGGQWFQLWQGEIVSMASPETPHERGTVARLHRGSVVHKAS